jgi:hypothetical protein
MRRHSGGREGKDFGVTKYACKAFVTSLIDLRLSRQQVQWRESMIFSHVEIKDLGGSTVAQQLRKLTLKHLLDVDTHLG